MQEGVLRGRCCRQALGSAGGQASVMGSAGRLAKAAGGYWGVPDQQGQQGEHPGLQAGIKGAEVGRSLLQNMRSQRLSYSIVGLLGKKHGRSDLLPFLSASQLTLRGDHRDVATVAILQTACKSCPPPHTHTRSAVVMLNVAEGVVIVTPELPVQCLNPSKCNSRAHLSSPGKTNIP